MSVPTTFSVIDAANTGDITLLINALRTSNATEVKPVVCVTCLTVVLLLLLLHVVCIDVHAYQPINLLCDVVLVFGYAIAHCLSIRLVRWSRATVIKRCTSRGAKCNR
jgi:hypothetical protein